MVALLDSHPRIAMSNEAAWITFLRKAFLLSSTPSSQWVDDGEGFRTPGILPERYTRDFALSFLTTLEPFVHEFFRRIAGPGKAGPGAAGLDGHDYYGDKVMSCNDLAFAIERFPGATFLQLVRDPRDMIASTFAFQNKQRAAWEQATFQVRVDHMNTFLRDTTAMLKNQRNLLVRYEDLITDVETRSREIFSFLGLSITPEENTFLQGAAQKLFTRHGTSESPTASIGRWRQDMTPEQQAACNSGLESVLLQFGYAV